VSGLFWLSDLQWAAIEPHLPMVHTEPRRVDDRRVISGIAHRLREGCRWRALPPEYGPYTTVFNRWNRWSQRGLWQGIYAALVACADPPEVTRERLVRDCRRRLTRKELEALRRSLVALADDLTGEAAT
jgi:transposase